MHNLHLIRVKADTPQEACKRVESSIEDYGTENNWRTICGCLSERGEAFELGGGRWTPKQVGYNTIEDLNTIVTGWMEPSTYKADLIQKVDDGEVKISELTDRMDLYAVKQWVNQLSMVIDVGLEDGDSFDILRHTFFDYEYTECGVTECYGDGENTYIVFVDMHD